jgi:hypothetical protein
VPDPAILGELNFGVALPHAREPVDLVARLPWRVTFSTETVSRPSRAMNP